MKVIPYFHGRVNSVQTKHGIFEPGDYVKILSSSKNWPVRRGTILYLVKSNHGKGRIHAFIELDGKNFYAPIGACRHI